MIELDLEEIFEKPLTQEHRLSNLLYTRYYRNVILAAEFDLRHTYLTLFYCKKEPKSPIAVEIRKRFNQGWVIDTSPIITYFRITNDPILIKGLGRYKAAARAVSRGDLVSTVLGPTQYMPNVQILRKPHLLRPAYRIKDAIETMDLFNLPEEATPGEFPIPVFQLTKPPE